MRIVMVWITALVLMTSITVGYYISNTVFNTIASNNMDLIGTSGEGFNLLKLLEYVNIAWGPIFDFIVLLWALTYPAERDAYSY
jgi:Ni,Fe-hydrogenase I cytochrome b subunit